MLISRAELSKKTAHPAGEGYLASSTDLMIGILFIFIIMVVYLAMELKEAEVVPLPEIEPAPDPVRTLVTQIGAQLEGMGVRVQLDPDSGVIALPADALFDRGQAVPMEGAMKAITSTEIVLLNVLPCYVDSDLRAGSNCSQLNSNNLELETVMIEGHTDSNQYPNDPSRNWHLGLDRARFIFEEFGKGELGTLKNRKGQPLLGLSSYADTRPSKILVQSQDPLAKDRRVELRFILSYQSETSQPTAVQAIQSIQLR